MEFIKNFLALMLSTVVWAAGLCAIISPYYAIVEQDIFYLIMLGLCLLIIGVGLLIGRYNIRVQAALEFPFGMLHL